MSTVKINPDQLIDCSRELGEVGEHSSRLASKIALNNNLVGFTRVSGLDQLGREHAGVLDTGPGSARVVAQGLGDVIGGLARGLQATVQGFEAQEDVFARSLDRLHDAGSSSGMCGGESGGVPAEKLGIMDPTPWMWTPGVKNYLGLILTEAVRRHGTSVSPRRCSGLDSHTNCGAWMCCSGHTTGTPPYGIQAGLQRFSDLGVPLFSTWS